MSIGINFVLNVPNAPNIVAFDKTNSAISAIVAKMLRNPILLILRKINFKRAHNANGDNEEDKT